MTFRGIVIDPERPEFDGQLVDHDSPMLVFPLPPRDPVRCWVCPSPANPIEPSSVDYRFLECNWSGADRDQGFWVPWGQPKPLDYVFLNLVAGYRRTPGEL